MEIPVEEIISRQFAMGIFAVYVGLVSLVRIMAEQEFFRLTILKKLWGRTRGLIIHFVSNIALPLVFGVVFFTQGVAGFSNPESLKESLFFSLTTSSHQLQVAVEDKLPVPSELVPEFAPGKVSWCSEILPP